LAKLTRIIEEYEKEKALKETEFQFQKEEFQSNLRKELIPEIKLHNVAPQIVTFHNPDDIVSENFKILRSQILHPRAGIPSRFILVTSSVPQEGKTYIAINLAFSFAKTVPTLLLEFDLRCPSFHEVLGFKCNFGLSSYLIENLELEKCIYKTNYKNLYIMPAGKTSLDGKDYLLSEKVLILLDSLRNNFSDFFFIFDSPPVLVASESIALSRLVDSVIFVVKYGFSDKEVLSEALDKIGRSKVLGTVFNGFRPSFFSFFSPKFKYLRYAYRYKYYKK